MASIQATKDGMNNILKCSLCSEDYSFSKHSPKILKCGHTYCLVCLYELIRYIQMCPTCNQPVEEPVSNFPTNYVILSDKNYVTPKGLRSMELEIAKIEIENRKSRVANSMTVLNHLSEKLESYTKSLKEWSDVDVDVDVDEDEAHKLEENINTIGKELKEMDIVYYSCFKPHVKATFTLNSYSTKEEFLNQIVVSLYQKKVLYAFNSQWYNKDTYWAKMDYTDGKLCIHSFSDDIPPIPSDLVSFSDLKKCMSCFNFQTFIDIEEEKFICTMIKSSKSTLNFIKLCSGEDGFSFTKLKAEIILGSVYFWCNFNTGKYSLNKTGCLDDYEFLESLQPSRGEISEGKMCIKMCNGKCKIEDVGLPVVNEEIVDTVRVSGKRISPQYTEKYSSVHDSGIYLLFPIDGKSKVSVVKFCSQ
ncbi:hypothetical protein Anas_11830 [Armadillidium nasatum]|uniref:RING-type domain-containing protein n=1 Tax=Armadillidium nasatum TaxID=96803 RepID=A0A5N5TFQ4_9CRUS|nr:hypothetical protein Anas_11830 [Armadillidium nasatum]